MIVKEVCESKVILENQHIDYLNLHTRKQDCSIFKSLAILHSLPTSFYLSDTIFMNNYKFDEWCNLLKCIVMYIESTRQSCC